MSYSDWKCVYCRFVWYTKLACKVGQADNHPKWSTNGLYRSMTVRVAFEMVRLASKRNHYPLDAGGETISLAYRCCQLKSNGLTADQYRLFARVSAQFDLKQLGLSQHSNRRGELTNWFDPSVVCLCGRVHLLVGSGLLLRILWVWTEHFRAHEWRLQALVGAYVVWVVRSLLRVVRILMLGLMLNCFIL